MIATRKVFPGEVILSETPLIVVPNRIFRDFQKVETFIERRLNVMSCEDRDRFLSMADCCDGAGLGFCGRFYTNAMNYAGDACVCPDMAKANHSCRPNAEFVTRASDGKQVLVAMYVVEAGEEVTINYLDMAEEGADTRDTRRTYLRTSYGFCCFCRACTLQDKDLDEDNTVREAIKVMQSVGTNNLEPGELEELVTMLYKIHGKLSYIITLFDELHRSAVDGTLKKLEYAISGCSLALNIFGAGSSEVLVWKNRIEQEKSIHGHR